MNTYLKLDVDRPTDLSEQLDNNYPQGTTWEDYQSGMWIKLSTKQVNFFKANPDASKEEIFNCKLTTYERTIEQARMEKVHEIRVADKSASHFLLNGVPFWLEKDLRTSLKSLTIPALKEEQIVFTKLWTNDTPPISVDIPVSFLEENMTALELFSKEVYDNTQTLIASVYTKNSVSEIDTFEINGYPKAKVFNL